MKRTPLQRKTPLTSGGPRRKRCPSCRVMFVPARDKQAVCGEIECAIAYSKSEKGQATARKAFAELGRKELRASKERIKTRGQYMREAQAAFNAWVRARDASQPCISCGRHHEGKYDAGHYRTVGSNPALRFEPLNCHKQCVPCNQHKSGDIVNYRMSLVLRIGQDKVDWLEGPHEPQRYTIEELKTIRSEYQAKTKALKGARA
ncbi:recombination protein NinG [Pseudomonas lactis]|uniref:Recombination protein NinG n=1 Tax=Pseudomonas lactis TaxID=1615674 RepID=A0A7Y1MFS2_9PSED|nr:recombination protein NinG [Pseudomonas lactis]KRP78083.1 bacteriophage lambda NinG family protein [Pseudomonas lactis]NNA81035.1 recombination protein NinG [Pseudomonas lactis]